MGMDCTIYLHPCTTVQLPVLVCSIYSHVVGYSFAGHHLLASSPSSPFLHSNKWALARGSQMAVGQSVVTIASN